MCLASKNEMIGETKFSWEITPGVKVCEISGFNEDLPLRLKYGFH